MQNQNDLKEDFYKYFMNLKQSIGVEVCDKYNYEDHILTKFDQIPKLYEDKKQKEYVSSIIGSLYGYGIETPSNVQSLAMLPILEGNDCIVQAQSGSGKTLTFLTTAMAKIIPSKKNMQVLIITSTRELAHQIFLVGTTVFKNTGIRFALQVGGNKNGCYYDSDNYLETELTRPGYYNEQIVIGTPGRIKDLLDNKKLNNNDLSLLILDEVDYLLANGLIETIEGIIRTYIKKTNQICIFSATLPTYTLQTTDKFMNNPIRILIPEKRVNLDGIKQAFVNCEEAEYKPEILSHLLEDFKNNVIIIYVNSIKTLDILSKYLTDNNINNLAISSSFSQIERFKIMDQFKHDRKNNILISTDLTARGIDIHQITLVINYDIPTRSETYIHRIGRTGRFGRTGTAINLVTDDDKDILNEYIKKYGIDMKKIE